MEIWNLVFMQSIRGEGSTKDDFEILGDLPAKSVDTGTLPGGGSLTTRDAQELIDHPTAPRAR